MISLYRPGSSALHRTPTWIKLLTLLIVAIALSVWGTHWQVFGSIGVLALLTMWCCFGAATTAAQIWSLRWIVLLMVVPQIFFLGWHTAAANTARVAAVLLLAQLITMSTPMTQLLDTLQAGLEPLRRFGVHPQRIALLLSLTITCIPMITGIAAQLREALIARGHRSISPRILFPLLVLTLQHADQLAEALHARGIELD